jgi:hypothetical protein
VTPSVSCSGPGPLASSIGGDSNTLTGGLHQGLHQIAGAVRPPTVAPQADAAVAGLAALVNALTLQQWSALVALLAASAVPLHSTK